MVQLSRKLSDVTRSRVRLMRSLLIHPRLGVLILSLFITTTCNRRCILLLFLFWRLLGALGLRVETDHRELNVLVVRR